MALLSANREGAVFCMTCGAAVNKPATGPPGGAHDAAASQPAVEPPRQPRPEAVTPPQPPPTAGFRPHHSPL